MITLRDESGVFIAVQRLSSKQEVQLLRLKLGKMNLSAEIVVRGDVYNIEKLFIPEEKTFKNQRASYELKRTKDKIVFKIKAEDGSALRAVLNSITKLISVYEDTQSFVKK